MAIAIFSILGVVCAFLGLGVFLLSMISLLPVNLYNAVMSCIKLQHAIPVLSKSVIPTLFFVGNILIALVSAGLFYMITRTQQRKNDGKTDNGAGGSTTSKKSPVGNDQTSNHNVFSHHKHSLMNGYTYAYVSIDVIWALIGSLLLYTLVSNGTENNDGSNDPGEKKLLLVIEAMRSQVSIIYINIMVLAAAACTMGVSSLFFILGRKKISHEEARPLFSVV